MLRTHLLGHRILPSVTRKAAVALIPELRRSRSARSPRPSSAGRGARDHRGRAPPVEERAITEAELRRADELFLWGTASNVTRSSASTAAPSAPPPGPITARLRDALDARLYGGR